MPKEEIIHGLKNAIERGSSLNAAKQSFINAGYDPREVEEAARFVGGGTITQYPQLSQHPQQAPQAPQAPQMQQSPQTKFQKPRKSKAGVIVLLIFLIILIAALVTSFIFREKILDFFTNLF